MNPEGYGGGGCIEEAFTEEGDMGTGHLAPSSPSRIADFTFIVGSNVDNDASAMKRVEFVDEFLNIVCALIVLAEFGGGVQGFS